MPANKLVMWFAPLYVLLTVSIYAQSLVCPPAPVPPAVDMSEAQAMVDYNKILLEAPGCIVATDPKCDIRAKDLLVFKNDVLQAMAAQNNCAAKGTYAAGGPLAKSDQDYYSTRGALWYGTYTDLAAHSTEMANGTYSFPALTQKALLGIVGPLPPLIVSKTLANGAQKLSVKGQPIDANYSSSTVVICVWETSPQPGSSTDCTAPGSKPGPAMLAKIQDGSQPTHIGLDKNGNASVSLAKPLTTGELVSVVEIATLQKQPAGGSPPVPQTKTSISEQLLTVSASSQCNRDPNKDSFSDCDMSFSLIGGIEQAGLSSQPSATDGFLRVFTRAGDKGGYFWGLVRLLSAPQQSSTSGVISDFSNPSGTITSSAVSNVGTSVDYMIGGEYLFPTHTQYTVSFIAGLGGTTPLSSNSVSQAFTAPSFGTVECNVLYSKFASYFNNPTYNILLGKAGQATPVPPATTASSCLLNGNSSSTPANGATTYSAINTIAFSNQDRHSFLGKYEFGIRTIDHFLQPGMKACGDSDPGQKIGPCQRGIVDLTIGQDASVTRGQLRNWVLKLDAVHPLPIKGTAYVYLFGSFSMRFEHNVNDTPLILQAASLTTIGGSGSAAVPNLNTVVLPLVQPNRDFYRFGIGLDIACIFTKLFAASPTCSAASPSSTSSGN